MGMTCALYRATAAEIEALIKDPETLESFIEGIEGPGLPVREVRPKGMFGLLLRLTPIKITEVVPESERDGPTPPPPDPERSVSIEKAWHGLHFLFTGTSDGGEEPANYLTEGGEVLDDEGFARALRPDQTRRFAVYLSSLTRADLERRYDAQRMNQLEIYPGSNWAREEPSGDSPRAWLLASFEEVKTFVNKAATAGDGVVIHIS